MLLAVELAAGGGGIAAGSSDKDYMAIDQTIIDSANGAACSHADGILIRGFNLASDAIGNVQIWCAANASIGSYNVSVSTPGPSGPLSVDFTLTNEPNDRIFGDGFDGAPLAMQVLTTSKYGAGYAVARPRHARCRRQPMDARGAVSARIAARDGIDFSRSVNNLACLPHLGDDSGRKFTYKGADGQVYANESSK